MNTSATLVKSTSFVKKLAFLGLATLFLVVLISQLVSGSLFKQGPKLASAEAPFGVDSEGLPSDSQETAPAQSTQVSNPSCNEDTYYNDNGRKIHKSGGYWGGSECVYEFKDVGLWDTSSQSDQPQAQNCSDDVYYPDNGRRIHKHGGYLSGSECVYAFDDTGPVDSGNSSNSGNSGNPGIDNSSNSNSNSSPDSRSIATASVKNKIKITNNNYQTQSQVVYLTQAQQAAQVIIRERERRAPAVTQTTKVSYTAEQSNVCPANTTKVVNGGTVDCVVNSQPQPQVITVVGSTAKELPKTGTPLGVLALGALAPLGLKLRKFGKRNTDLTANYLWEERELNRN